MAETKAKQTKAAAQKAADEAGVTERVTEGAREFVKRSTESAKERTDGLYDASKKYNADLENFLLRAARGYVNVLGNVADATYANLNHTFAAAEKLAEAKSLKEAVEIQSEFVREQSATNMENVRSAYDYVREVVASNTETLRETASKTWTPAKGDDKAA